MNKNNLSVAVLVAVLVFTLGFLAGNSTDRGMMESMDGAHHMPMGNSMDHSMGSMMDSMSAALSGKTGDEFDKAFLDEMVVHHEGAVVMARQVLATSKRPELITLANDIIEAQTKEIGMMKGWRQAWFK